MIRAPVYVEDELAYNRATEARIKANRTKGGRKRYLATYPDAQAVLDWLAHNAKPGFLAKMADACEEWGGLSPGQHAAVVKIMTENSARKAEWHARDAASAYVGKRLALDLRVTFVTDFESTYGVTYVHGFADAAGNKLVHKGSALGPAKGQAIRLKATVKRHEEYKGVRTTYLSRPVVEAME